MAIKIILLIFPYQFKPMKNILLLLLLVFVPILQLLAQTIHKLILQQ